MKRYPTAVLVGLFSLAMLTTAAVNLEGQEHAVVVLTGYPSAPNNWDWNNLSLNVDVHTSSSNAPAFHTGDNFAQAVADLMNQGYKLQGPPKFDENGWGCSVMLVK
jgi:hypothetical protein